MHMRYQTVARGAALVLVTLVVARWFADLFHSPPDIPARPDVVPIAVTRDSVTPTFTPPFRIEPGMLWTIQHLPPDLARAIAAASPGSRAEIIAAQQTSAVPLEPMAPPSEEAWCLTVYPEAHITLYVQPYIAPPGAVWVRSGDFIPGEQRTGWISQFSALKRRERWELYHPEVYDWSSLGCDTPTRSS